MSETICYQRGCNVNSDCEVTEDDKCSVCNHPIINTDEFPQPVAPVAPVDPVA